MKAFLWLLTAAMGIVCLSCWAMGELAMRSLSDLGYPLPNFTRMVLRPHGWLFFAPLPWFVYSAVLSFRRDVSPRAAFIFAGTIVFATTVLVCAVVIAALLPYIPLKVGR